MTTRTIIDALLIFVLVYQIVVLWKLHNFVNHKHRAVREWMKPYADIINSEIAALNGRLERHIIETREDCENLEKEINEIKKGKKQ